MQSRDSRTGRFLPRWIPLFLLPLLLCVGGRGATPAIAPAAASPPSKLLFWKVQSPTTEAWFLGAIHLGKPSMYPLPVEVESAFRQAGVLVVELDITKVDEAAIAAQTIEKGVYPMGDSLDKHLSAATAEALREFCGKNRISWQTVAQLKPGLAVQTMEQGLVPGMSLVKDLGIDRHFIIEAHADKTKRIVGLETAREQVDVLLTMDDNDAESFMKGVMSQNSKEVLGEMVDCWMTGDAEGTDRMVHSAQADAAERQYTQRLVDDRNVRMTAKIRELLKGKEKLFVTVGAAHMVGEKGILAMLAKDGLRIEQPVVTLSPRARAEVEATREKREAAPQEPARPTP
jgi:uncharacterized protein YbaP (TraB family)